MAHITADRVRDTSTSTGTGNFTVSGTAPIGFRTLSAVLSVGDTFYYAIQGQGTSEWEVGLGTYSSANVFARTTVLSSSNAGSAVSFSASTKDVFLTLAASKTIQTNASGNVGIGTDSPTQKLQVYSSAGSGGQIQVTNSATGATSTDGVLFGYDGSNDVILNNQENTQIKIYTNNTERARISASGNVGIGTNAPTQKLDVSGNVNVSDTVAMGSSFMRNRLINGNLNIWQRGTSFSGSGTTTYTADRWCNVQYAGSTSTISRVSSGLTGATYAIRVQRPNGTTNTETPNLAQCIETQNCLDMAGKTITLSFYARVGSNFSATSSILISGIATGTGTDQNLYTTGYTGQTTYTQNNTVSTSWQRFTQTITIASSVTEVSVYFYYIPTGTAGANDYYDLSLLQLEVGSVATPFEYEPVSQTLTKCQRYFEKNFPINVAPAHNAGYFIPIPNAGSFGCGGNQYATVSFRVSKRTTPSGRYYDPSGTASASTNAFRYTTACNLGSQATVTSFDSITTEFMGGYFQAVTDASIQFFWTADAEI